MTELSQRVLPVPALLTTTRFRLGQSLCSTPVIAWLFLIVILPNLLLIGTSFLQTSSGLLVFEPTLKNYARMLNSPGFWMLLVRTLILSFAGCVLATLIAYPLAFYVGRISRRSKALLSILVVLPLWIGLLMRIFAWRVILGQSGVLNAALVSSGLLDEPSSAFLYSPLSVVVVFAYYSVPFIFISTMSAFEKIPQDLFESSQDSGATAWQTFRHMVWPLTRRNLAIGFSLAFLVTVGDFVTPAMIGGIDGTTVGVLISSQFGAANNWPYGAAVAVTLMLAVTLLLGAIFALAPSKGIVVGGEADPSTQSPAHPVARRLGALGFSAVIVYLYLPLVIVVLFSFNAANLQTFPLQSLSLQWYVDIVQDQSLIAAVKRSLLVAFCVVAVSVTVGTVFALTIFYTRLKSARTYELLFALPIATPGVVLGIEMVLGTAILGIPSGVARVVIGQMSFAMPVTMLLLLVRLRRLDPSLMEASLDLGANHWQSFTHVLLPLIGGTIAAGAFLSLTLSADDVMVTMFLTGGEPTLPIWVFNQMRFGFSPTVNAVFALLIATILTLVTIANLVARKKNA